MEQGTNQRYDVSDQDQENGPNNRQRTHTLWSAKDYAHRVHTYTRNTASESLHPGDSLRNLGDFLWQPYLVRAPQIYNAPEPTANTETQQGPFFVSLYQISNGNMERTPLDTPQQFEDLGESVMPNQNGFSLLLLQGYPSAKWLNALGARYSIDPEYYHRHLIFASATNKGPFKRTATHILPSCLEDMVSLKVTRIGSRQSTKHSGSDQEKLDALRAHTSREMAEYMTKLASLNTTGIEAGNSIVREFSLHDFDNFSLEQTISIGIHRSGQGWIGIIWYDDGSSPEKGLKGPWLSSAIGSNPLDMRYLPTPFHVPGIALKSKKRKPSAPFITRRRPLTRMELLLDDYPRLVRLARATYDPFYALSPFFKFAISSELDFLELISAKIRDILDHSRLIRHDNPTLSNILFHQQVLKRHIHGLQAPIYFMEEHQKSQWVEKMTDEVQKRECTKTISSILNDYRTTLVYAEALAGECAQGMSIVAHNASILEAEKAISEARGVTKLTRLATIFAPLAFVTSVFSMNVQQINSNGPDIWWWICISAVIAVVTVLFFRYDMPHSWREWWKRYSIFNRNDEF
ncbi:hypothetical protein ABKA04_007864 [Annulohypoxylon sp. FPYF3050]